MSFDPLFKTFTAPAVTQICINCGMPFAVPSEWDAQRRQDQKPFWCPNGHQQHYTGKSEAQKVREQLERETRRREAAENRLVVAQRQVSARQGQITKLRKKMDTTTTTTL